MIRFTRHGVPSTLTTAGTVSQTWVPGEADVLRGAARYLEVYTRFRRKHGRRQALRLTAAAWRHGVTLSGPRVRGKGGAS